MNVHEVILITQSDQDMQAPDCGDFNKLCRLCLQAFQPESSKNIHKDEVKMNIRDLIEVYTFVKIPEYNDELPQTVCEKCLEFLIEIHMFRNRCRLNNDLLLKVQRRAISGGIKQEGREQQEDIALPQDEAQSLLDTINNKRLKVYECSDCHQMYNNVHDLRTHRREAKHPRTRTQQCPHCNKMFTHSALKSHVRTHTGEKPFGCHVCGMAFAIKKNLMRHWQIHQERAQYACKLCEKTFTRTESLAHHMKTHTNNTEEYLCSVCNRIYQSLEQLRIHLRYHTKSFLCNTCGKVFTSKAHLTTHIRGHTGEKPFVCHICKQRYTGVSSLKNHLAMHEGQRGRHTVKRPKKTVAKGPQLLETTEIELSTTE